MHYKTVIVHVYEKWKAILSRIWKGKVIRPSVQSGFTNVHKDYTQRIITMPHSWKDKLSLKQL